LRLVATALCLELQVLTDGVVTLRPPRPGDAEVLVEGRDEEFFRWLGPGAETPSPVACVWAGDELVGWKGYASRAVELLLLHLDSETEHTIATLLIHPENVRSLRLARRLGFESKGQVEGDVFFVREVSHRPKPRSPRRTL
jgi:RimJ/RimL family protein N-acetyltransferase